MIVTSSISIETADIGRRPHVLVERNAALDFIILGDGALSLARVCDLIARSVGVLHFSREVVVLIVLQTMVLYLQYMIYFDGLNEHMSSFSAHAWAVINGLYYLAIMQGQEAAVQSVAWFAALHRAKKLEDDLEIWLHNGRMTASTEFWKRTADEILKIATTLGETLKNVQASTSTITQVWPTHFDLASLNTDIIQATHYHHHIAKELIPAIRNGTLNAVPARRAMGEAVGVMTSMIYQIAGFQVHEDHHEDTIHAQEQLEKSEEIYAEACMILSFATMASMILFTVMNSINHGRFKWREVISTILPAFGFMALGIMIFSHKADFFLGKPAMIPLVLGANIYRTYSSFHA